MKISITRYGRREVVLALVLAVLAGGLCWWLWPQARWWAQAVTAVVFLMVAAFFRDPQRAVVDEWPVLLAPADGRVTDVVEVDEEEFIGARALRIGIFLSVFDVHINRAPCAGRVAFLRHQAGKCFNAMRTAAASEQNEAQYLGLDCPEHPAQKVMVKQITGAIARRIVCDCQVGRELDGGQKYGMIKFGSRTELFLPTESGAQVVVKKGDKVRAGVTVMVRYGTGQAVGSGHRPQNELSERAES